MSSRVLNLLFCSAALIGCGTTHKETALVAAASVAAEPHVIWTRPLEVGFEMGRYVEAESTSFRLFGCIPVAGDKTAKSAQVSMIGGDVEMSSAAKMAVAKAVQESKADGMYVLYVEERTAWSGLVKETTTFVRGRTLKLEDFGSVDQERATRVRVEEAGAEKEEQDD